MLKEFTETSPQKIEIGQISEVKTMKSYFISQYHMDY